MQARFAIGIDLGTTNSALAYMPLGELAAQITVLPVPQLTAPATVEGRPLLPSFMYLAAEAERSGQALDLPWATGRDYAVGEWARRQSADVPTRTVAAAKSWLSQSRFDRHQPILPFDAPASSFGAPVSGAKWTGSRADKSTSVEPHITEKRFARAFVSW